jgi:hypothetical protein
MRIKNYKIIDKVARSRGREKEGIRREREKEKV